MKNVNAITIVGLVINFLILLFTNMSDAYQVLTIPTTISLVLCITGVFLMHFNNVKIGSIMFYIGSVMFVPLGIVGIMGVRKTISKIEEDKFNKENYGKGI